MVPLMTELGVAAIITAIGTAIGSILAALWQGMKTRAEVSTMQAHMSKALTTAQNELTRNHGSSMKDSSVRSEGKLDRLIASHEDLGAKVDALTTEQARQGDMQTRQGDMVHALDRGLGGVRDDLRIIRTESGQTRSEVAEVRTSVAELDGKHDALAESADRTHRDLTDGQKKLADQFQHLAAGQTVPAACTGWDYGAHVTAHHTTQEDS